MIIVVEVLRNYNELQSQIEILESRISYIENLLQLDDLSELQYFEHKYYKKPLIPRPTETRAINLSKNQTVTRNELKKDKDKIKSILFDKEYQVKEINIALKRLIDVQKYIIECKYFERMTYNQILENLQKNKFKQLNTWCLNTIVNVHNKAIEIMQKIVNNNTLKVVL